MQRTILTSDPKGVSPNRRVYAITPLPQLLTPQERLRSETNTIVRAEYKRQRKNTKRSATQTGAR